MTEQPICTTYLDGSKGWYLDGKLYRLDGPAYIGYDGIQAWYINDYLHRLDGPAWIDANGNQEWWINDKEITSDVERWMKQNNVTWPWDEQTQMQFVLTFT
jgi:hypothetical protein